MASFLSATLTVVGVVLISACGGGGESQQLGASTPTPTTSPIAAPSLSATQVNYEATTINDSYVYLDTSLPSTNVAPTSGIHWFYSSKASMPSSPTLGPTIQTIIVDNLSTSLVIPDQSRRFVERVIKNGAIYANNNRSKFVWSYSGDNIINELYAADGVTVMYSTTFDDWSNTVPLTGQISNSATLKSFFSFANLNTPLNFDFSKNWLPGAGYITRKSIRTNDTLFIFDWFGTSPTYDSNVNFYPGAPNTIENYFALSSWTYDGVVYNLASGSIMTIQGARTWIANNKRPVSFSATDAYLALSEINGKLYVGALQRSGARLKVIDFVDRTTVYDYAVRLNAKASDSIKQAVRF